MSRTPLWQAVLIIVTIIIGTWFALPNLFERPVVTKNDDGSVTYSEFVPAYLPQGQLNLGLDLQGGQYVLIEIDRDDALAQELNDMRLAARQFAADRGLRIRFRTLPATEEDIGGLQVRLSDEGAAALMQQELAPRSPFLSVSNTQSNVELVMTNDAAERFYRDLLDRTVEQFRSRIDAFGLTEPTITTQGDDRVVVQIPGNAIHIDDLTSVGELRFIIVGENQNDPALTVFPYQNPEGENEGETSLGLDEVRSIDGKNLVSASGVINDQSPTGAYLITFRFNAPGGIELCNLTSENQYQRMAVVFDGEILTAPTIQSPICGGNGQITGDFDQQEATTLATIMESGALPAKVSVLDARTVGPTLGAESIAAGTLAGLVGLLAVMVFMILFYGWFGTFATVALGINLVMLFGILSLFSATLTLPGIAGIVLTVGMAVDANVLVFERIREELKGGMSVGGAIDAGYKAAMSTIIDANLTTFVAAVTLAFFGAGPVRGFAITLGIGIITSMFTALLVTRAMISLWHGRNGPTKAPI